MTKIEPAGQYRGLPGHPLLSSAPAEFGPGRKPKRSSEESDPPICLLANLRSPLKARRRRRVGNLKNRLSMMPQSARSPIG